MEEEFLKPSAGWDPEPVQRTFPEPVLPDSEIRFAAVEKMSPSFEEAKIVEAVGFVPVPSSVEGSVERSAERSVETRQTGFSAFVFQFFDIRVRS